MSPLAVTITAVIGAAISLLFSFFPKLKEWYEAQAQKALIMAVVTLVGSVVYFALGCVPALAELLKISVACTSKGALDMAFAFLEILGAAQGTFVITKLFKK